MNQIRLALLKLYIYEFSSRALEAVPIFFILLLIEICLFKRDYTFSKKCILYVLIAELANLPIIGLGGIAHNDDIYFVCYLLSDFLPFFVFGFLSNNQRKFLRGLKFALLAYFIRLYIYYSLSNSIGLIINNLTYLDKLSVYEWNSTLIVFHLFYILLCLFIIFALYFGMYKRNLFIKLNLKATLALIFYIFVFVIILLSIYSDYTALADTTGPISVYYGATEKNTQTMLGILLIFASTFAPVIVMLLATGIVSKAEKSKQDETIQAQLDYIAQYKRNQEDTRAFRHDIKNNLSAISLILDKNNVTEAQEYIADLVGTISNYTQKYSTGNDMLDCILSMKAETMKSNGIHFSLDGMFENGLSMENPDICTVFANALDNAIEASLKIEDALQRRIEMKIKHTDNFYRIVIANNVSENEAGSAKASAKNTKDYSRKSYTSKVDSSMHGYGMGNMKKCLEKYNGMLNTELKDGQFILSIILGLH